MAEKDFPDYRARHSRYWNEEWHPFWAWIMSAGADVRRKIQSISLRRQNPAVQPENNATAAPTVEFVEGKRVVCSRKETTVKADIHQPREVGTQIPNNLRRVSRQAVARPVLNPLLVVSEVTESSVAKTEDTDANGESSDAKTESSECDGTRATDDQESNSVPEISKTPIENSEKKYGKEEPSHGEGTSRAKTRGDCRTSLGTHVCDVEADAENLIRIVLRHLAQARKETLIADGDVNLASKDSINDGVQSNQRSERTAEEDSTTVGGEELSPETFADGPPLNNATRSIYSHTLITLRNRLVSRSFLGSSSVHDVSYGDSCKAHDLSYVAKETGEAPGRIPSSTVVPLVDKGGGEDKAKTFADVSTLCRILSPNKGHEQPFIRLERRITGDRAKCSETMSDPRFAASCAEASVFGQSRIEAMLGSYRSVAGIMEAFPVLQESPRSTKRASVKNEGADVLSDSYHSCSQSSRSKESRGEQKLFGAGSMTVPSRATAQSMADKRDAAFSAAELHNRRKNNFKECFAGSYSSAVVPSAAKRAVFLGKAQSVFPECTNRAIEYVEAKNDGKPCLPKKNERVHYIDSDDFQADTLNITRCKTLSSPGERSGLSEVAKPSSVMKVTKKQSARQQAPPRYFDAKNKRGLSCKEETTSLLQMKTKINRELPPEGAPTSDFSGDCRLFHASSTSDRDSSDNSWMNNRDARTKTLNLFRPVTKAELVFKDSSTVKDHLRSDCFPKFTSRDNFQEASSLEKDHNGEDPAYCGLPQYATNRVLKEYPATVIHDEVLHDFPILRRNENSQSGTEQKLDKEYARLQPTVELASLSGLGIFNATTFGKLQLPFGVQSGIKKDKWNYAQKINNPTVKQDTTLPVFQVDNPVPSMTARRPTRDLASDFRKNLVSNVVNHVTKCGQEQDTDDQGINLQLTESELIRCINRLVGSEVILPENRERIFSERNVQQVPVAATKLMEDTWLHDNIVSSESLRSSNTQHETRNCSGTKSNSSNRPLYTLRRGDIKDMLKEILEEEYSLVLHSSGQNANLKQPQPNISDPLSKDFDIESRLVSSRELTTSDIKRVRSNCTESITVLKGASMTLNQCRKIDIPKAAIEPSFAKSVPLGVYTETSSCPAQYESPPAPSSTISSASSTDADSSRGTSVDSSEEVITTSRKLCAEPHLLDTKTDDSFLDRTSGTLKEGGDGRSSMESETETSSTSTSITSSGTSIEHAHLVSEHERKRTSQLVSDITIESSSMSKPTAIALPFAAFSDSLSRAEDTSKRVAFGAVKALKVSQRPPVYAAEVWNITEISSSFPGDRAACPERSATEAHVSLSLSSTGVHNHPKERDAMSFASERSNSVFVLPFQQSACPPLYLRRSISETRVGPMEHQVLHPEPPIFSPPPLPTFQSRPKSASYHGFSDRHDICNSKPLIQQSKAKSYTEFWLNTVSLFQEVTSDQLTSSSDAGVPLAFSDTTTMFDVAQMEAFERAAMDRQLLTAMADKYSDVNPLLETFLCTQVIPKGTPKPPSFSSRSWNHGSFDSTGLKVDKDDTQQHNNITARAPSATYEPFTFVLQDCHLPAPNVTRPIVNDLEHRSFSKKLNTYNRSRGRTNKVPYVAPSEASCQHEEVNDCRSPIIPANCSSQMPKKTIQAPPLEVQASYEDSSGPSLLGPKRVKTFRKKAPYRTPFPLCSTSRSTAASPFNSNVLKMRWDKRTIAQTSIPGCYKKATLHGTVPSGNVRGRRLSRSATIVMSEDLQEQPQRYLSALANIESSYLWNHRTRYCEDWLNMRNAYSPGKLIEDVATIGESPTAVPLENSEEIQSGSSTEYYEAA